MGTFSQYEYPQTRERYAKVADSLKLGGKNDEEKVERLIGEITKLKKIIGIKDSIKDYGFDE